MDNPTPDRAGPAPATSQTRGVPRRRFIIQEVLRHGFVSFEEVKGKFPGGNVSQAQTDDAAFFDAHAIPIIRAANGFALSSARYWTWELREQDRSPEKKAIGGFCAALLLRRIADDDAARENFEDAIFTQLRAQIDSKKPRKASPSSLVDLVTKYRLQASAEENVVKALDSVLNDFAKPKSPHPEQTSVDVLLTDFMKKPHRHAILDAGTTTAAIAAALAEIAPYHSVALRVVTNSPKLERLLEDPRIPIDVIAIGGQLRKDTAAHAGDLTDLCWSKWSLESDVAMIGATSLRFDHSKRPRAFACDSESEAHAKAQLLENSRIKCVVFDSSKFDKESSSSFEFAKASSQQVHIVITDSNTMEHKGAKPCIDWLKRQGIIVLEAPMRDK